MAPSLNGRPSVPSNWFWLKIQSSDSNPHNFGKIASQHKSGCDFQDHPISGFICLKNILLLHILFAHISTCLHVSSSTDKSVLEEEKSWRSDKKFSFHHQYCLPLTFHLAIVPDEESVWVWRNMLNETVLTRTIYDMSYKACCVGLPCALTFFGMLWHGILLCHSVWYGTLCTVLCWQVAFS